MRLVDPQVPGSMYVSEMEHSKALLGTAAATLKCLVKLCDWDTNNKPQAWYTRCRQDAFHLERRRVGERQPQKAPALRNACRASVASLVSQFRFLMILKRRSRPLRAAKQKCARSEPSNHAIPTESRPRGALPHQAVELHVVCQEEKGRKCESTLWCFRKLLSQCSTHENGGCQAPQKNQAYATCNAKTPGQVPLAAHRAWQASTYPRLKTLKAFTGYRADLHKQIINLQTRICERPLLTSIWQAFCNLKSNTPWAWGSPCHLAPRLWPQKSSAPGPECLCAAKQLSEPCILETFCEDQDRTP